jgi:hypothetical protein
MNDGLHLVLATHYLLKKFRWVDLTTISGDEESRKANLEILTKHPFGVLRARLCDNMRNSRKSRNSRNFFTSLAPTRSARSVYDYINELLKSWKYRHSIFD